MKQSPLSANLFRPSLRHLVAVASTIALVATASAQTLRPRVAIVGAGAAGLMAAETLREANVPYIVLEATDRAGGRILSRKDTDNMGLTLDEGANLINSTDDIAIQLIHQFNVKYVQRMNDPQDHMNYLIDGHHYNQAQAEALLYKRNGQTFWKMGHDQAARDKGDDVATNERLTNINVEDYLKSVNADPSFVTMIKSFFWSEYGKRLHEINAHVLFDYLHLDLNHKTFHLIPNVDEAFTLPEGVEQITAGLEKLNHDHIEYSQPIESIHSNADHSITLRSRSGSVTADYVIFAAPLHTLNSIKINVEGVTSQMLESAKKASYGVGAKMHLKFAPGFHDVYKFPGILVTDTGEQIWISSNGQNGAGLLTVLTGPLTTDPIKLQARVTRVLKQLELVAPGVSKLYRSMERTDAPATYSGAFQVGETADLDIKRLDGRFTIAGEHDGGALQGYLEGALHSGRKRAQSAISQVRPQVSHPSCRQLFN